MKKITLPLFVWILFAFQAYSQTTIDATNASNFLIGGDQVMGIFNVRLQEIKLVDVEPDPTFNLNFTGMTDLKEAGFGPFGINANVINEEAWVNISYRDINNTLGTLFIKSNQPIPSGVVIKVQIASQGLNTQFLGNPNLSEIIIDETNQILISGIRNGHTGDGIHNGFQLRFTLENPQGKSLPTNSYLFIYTLQ